MSGEYHSPLGASGAARWLACPPSFGLIQRTGAKDNESEHAALGTAAHKLADLCLASGKDAWEYVGQTIEGHGVGSGESEIDPDAVQVYLDYVRPLAEASDISASELRLGQKWKPHPLYGGTADFVGVTAEGIVVVDYKHGAGLGVEAEGNVQLLYYAIGAFKELGSHLPDDAWVTMVIVQPRYHGPPIKEAYMTVGELRAWSREVMVPGMLKAEASVIPDFTINVTEYTTGDHCRFCPAILDCPLQQQDFKAMQQDAGALNDSDLDEIFPKIATVKMFMRAVEARLQARLVEGAAYQNVKLVQKRAAGRVWKDGAIDLMVQQLGEDAYVKEPLSPAQASKLSAKWKAFVAENAFLPEATGYNLASAHDSQPSASPTADIEKQFAHFQ